MAPTFNQSSYASGSNVSSLTISSFNVSDHSNRTLVVVVTFRDNDANAPTVSSVVFNATENFTFRGRAVNNPWGDNRETCELWTLDNPTDATANVVATLSEAITAGTLVVLEFYGANNGIGANVATSTGSTSAVSASFTTGSSSSLIVMGVHYGDQYVTSTPNTGVTELTDLQGVAIGVNAGSWTGTKSASGGADTISITMNNNILWAAVAVELQAEAGGTEYSTSPSGSLTSAGTTAKQAGKAAAGSLTSAGAIIKQTRKSVIGSLTFAGALLRHILKVISGTLTSAGSTAKRAGKSLAGTLTSAAVVVTNKIAGLIYQAVGGTLTIAGSLAKRTTKIFSGNLTSTAVLVTNKIAGLIYQAVSGTLASAGSLARRTGKSLAGTLAAAGSAARRTAKITAGALPSAGSTAKRTGKSAAGMLAGTGAVARRSGKAFSGVLSSAGGLAKQVYRVLDGTLSFVNSLIRQMGELLTKGARILSVREEARVLCITADDRAFLTVVENRILCAGEEGGL